MKKSTAIVLIILAAACVAFGVIVGIPLLKKYTPTKEVQDLNTYYGLTSEDQAAIVMNEEKLEETGLYKNGTVYLSYSFIHNNLNSRVYWDYNESLLLYAFDTLLFQAEPDQVYSDYSEVPIVTVVDGEAYIEIAFMQKYSDFIYTLCTDPCRVVITNTWVEREVASVTSDTELRTLGGIKCPILKKVSKTETLTVLARDEKWSKVATEDGIIGFVRSRKLSDGTGFIPVGNYEEEVHEHIRLNGKVCLLWHQVTNMDSNNLIEEEMKDVEGVNVLSPTWFLLADNDGNITSYASEDYVSFCHDKGIQVWPTINDVDITDVDVDAVLSHTTARTNLIDQIVSAATAIQCDGINVDLERTTAEGCGSSFIEFVRELSIRCAEEGLILSVDNTRPYYFNQYYDRAEQAKYADYVVFMGYDQHYNGSEDGSVADLAWVGEGVADTLAQDVPPEQLILGCPFYTRVWEVTPKADAPETEERLEKYDITSTVYGMGRAASIAAEKGAKKQWIEELGQNYAEWEEDGTTYEVWLEDEDSVAARLDLMNQKGLGGAAFWKLGLESSEIWATISPYF